MAADPTWLEGEQATFANQQSTLSPQTISPGTVNPLGDPSTVESQVLAAQMANWEQVYKPVELAQIQQDSMMNPSVLPDALAQATAQAQGTSATMQGVEGRQLAARGIQATPQQQMVNGRMNNLSTAANVAGAQNKARQTVATQDELILTGSAPNPNIVNGSQLSQASGG